MAVMMPSADSKHDASMLDYQFLEEMTALMKYDFYFNKSEAVPMIEFR